MAGSRKAAVAALGNVDLKAPKNADGAKLMIEELEKLASEYRDTDAQISRLKEEQKARKAKIVAKAAKFRLKAELGGSFYKSCSCTTDDDFTVAVVWADRYSLLDKSHEPMLRRAFGEDYDDLLEETVLVKLDPGTTEQRFIDALGTDAYDALRGFVTLTPKLKLQDGFMAKRARMRDVFDAKTNESIDTIVAQVQSDPTVKVQAPKKTK